MIVFLKISKAKVYATKTPCMQLYITIFPQAYLHGLPSQSMHVGLAQARHNYSSRS